MPRIRRFATICVAVTLPLLSAGFIDAANAAPAVGDDARTPISAAGNGLPDECNREHYVDPASAGATCWGGGTTRRFQAIVHCDGEPGRNRLGEVHGLEVTSWVRCPGHQHAHTVGVNTWR